MHVLLQSAHFRSCARCFRVCTLGIAFPLLHEKQFEGVSGFDITNVAYPYPAMNEYKPEFRLGGGVHFVVSRFSSKVTFSSFSSCDCCLPPR